MLPVFGNVKHINPQYSADGTGLYFISDQDGFADVYGLSFETGAITRHTNLATAVSGFTYLTPAMSVANDGTLAYTVFDELEFHVYTSNVNDPAPAVTVAENVEMQPGRRLPPVNPDRFSRIATYLADAQTGLLPSGTYEPEDAEEYEPGLSLDYVGQPVLGVGTDSYGNYIGGATSAYFSDMLGNRILGRRSRPRGPSRTSAARRSTPTWGTAGTGWWAPGGFPTCSVDTRSRPTTWDRTSDCRGCGSTSRR